MSCRDCEIAQAGDGSAFFRWGNADIEIRGCGQHVGEVMAVLWEYREDILSEDEKD